MNIILEYINQIISVCLNQICGGINVVFTLRLLNTKGNVVYDVMKYAVICYFSLAHLLSEFSVPHCVAKNPVVLPKDSGKWRRASILS